MEELGLASTCRHHSTHWGRPQAGCPTCHQACPAIQGPCHQWSQPFTCWSPCRPGAQHGPHPPWAAERSRSWAGSCGATPPPSPPSPLPLPPLQPLPLTPCPCSSLTLSPWAPAVSAQFYSYNMWFFLCEFWQMQSHYWPSQPLREVLHHCQNVMIPL